MLNNKCDSKCWSACTDVCRGGLSVRALNQSKLKTGDFYHTVSSTDEPQMGNFSHLLFFKCQCHCRLASDFTKKDVLSRPITVHVADVTCYQDFWRCQSGYVCSSPQGPASPKWLWCHCDAEALTRLLNQLKTQNLFYQDWFPYDCFIIQILTPDASCCSFFPPYRPITQIHLSLTGNCIQSCVKASWMWPSPVSSPWTAPTPPRPPPHRIPPRRPPRSPPPPAPLPNWGHPFTWALSPDCKHTNGLPTCSPPCSVPAPLKVVAHATRPNFSFLFFSFSLRVLLRGVVSRKLDSRGTDRKRQTPCVSLHPLAVFSLPPQADWRSSGGCGAAPTETVVPYVFSNASLMRLPVSLLSTVTCTCSISICTVLKKKVSVWLWLMWKETTVKLFISLLFSISSI